MPCNREYTEEDTFRALCRIPFESMLGIIREINTNCSRNYIDSRTRIKLSAEALKGGGWNKAAYDVALAKHVINNGYSR